MESYEGVVRRLSRRTEADTMKEEWKAATTREVNALKAVEEPMFINARRKFTSMVKPIDQRGRAEPGWIYEYFFLSERVIGSD